MAIQQENSRFREQDDKKNMARLVGGISQIALQCLGYLDISVEFILECFTVFHTVLHLYSILDSYTKNSRCAILAIRSNKFSLSME